jgi:hypothetical protein
MAYLEGAEPGYMRRLTRHKRLLDYFRYDGFDLIRERCRHWTAFVGLDSRQAPNACIGAGVVARK